MWYIHIKVLLSHKLLYIWAIFWNWLSLEINFGILHAFKKRTPIQKFLQVIQNVITFMENLKDAYFTDLQRIQFVFFLFKHVRHFEISVVLSQDTAGKLIYFNRSQCNPTRSLSTHGVAVNIKHNFLCLQIFYLFNSLQGLQ